MSNGVNYWQPPYVIYIYTYIYIHIYIYIFSHINPLRRDLTLTKPQQQNHGSSSCDSDGNQVPGKQA